MKRTISIAAFATITSLGIWAATQTLTGEISESMCSNNHASMGSMGKNPKACTVGCVKAGAKYVLISAGKVYGIQNQGFSTLAAYAGGKV